MSPGPSHYLQFGELQKGDHVCIVFTSRCYGKRGVIVGFTPKKVRVKIAEPEDGEDAYQLFEPLVVEIAGDFRPAPASGHRVKKTLDNMSYREVQKLVKFKNRTAGLDVYTVQKHGLLVEELQEFARRIPGVDWEQELVVALHHEAKRRHKTEFQLVGTVGSAFVPAESGMTLLNVCRAANSERIKLFDLDTLDVSSLQVRWFSSHLFPENHYVDDPQLAHLFTPGDFSANCKVQVIAPLPPSADIPLAMRGIPIRLLRFFHHTICPGRTSREKVTRLLQICHERMSFVEWAMEQGTVNGQTWSTGPPCAMVSYAWESDWDYMVEYLATHLEGGEEACVWVDILAVNQHLGPQNTLVEVQSREYGNVRGNLTREGMLCNPLESGRSYPVRLHEGPNHPARHVKVDGRDLRHVHTSGDMSEILKLPHVINFAGQMMVMPGTVERLWCVYEYGWSIHHNRQLKYCYDVTGNFDRMLVDRGLWRDCKKDELNSEGAGVRCTFEGAGVRCTCVTCLVARDEARLSFKPAIKIIESADCNNKGDFKTLFALIDKEFDGQRGVLAKHIKNSFAHVWPALRQSEFQDQQLQAIYPARPLHPLTHPLHPLTHSSPSSTPTTPTPHNPSQPHPNFHHSRSWKSSISLPVGPTGPAGTTG
jgi:hypothetical protein